MSQVVLPGHAAGYIANDPVSIASRHTGGKMDNTVMNQIGIRLVKMEIAQAGRIV